MPEGGTARQTRGQRQVQLMFNSGIIKEIEKRLELQVSAPPTPPPLLSIEVQQSQPSEDYSEGTI